MPTLGALQVLEQDTGKPVISAASSKDTAPQSTPRTTKSARFTPDPPDSTGNVGLSRVMAGQRV